MEDDQLVERCLSGESDAWNALVERYAGYVAAILRIHRTPANDQADAFQIVFLELHRSLEGLRSTSSLKAWLRTVASRQAIKMRHWSARQPETGMEDEVGRLADKASLDADLQRAERDHQVRLALDEISGACRKLIDLLFFEDPPRPYEAVAREVGLSLGSIGMTRRRCLEKLEAVLRRRGVN